MEFKVGDKVGLNLDYFLIECGGKVGRKVNGLLLKKEEFYKATIIAHIDSSSEKYNIKITGRLGETTHFNEKELIKLGE